MSSAKLEEYRNKLSQVEAAIAADPENPEWTKLRDDLNEVIELTSQLEQVQGSSAEHSHVETSSFSVGEKCQAIYEQDGQYYNAKVLNLTLPHPPHIYPTPTPTPCAPRYVTPAPSYS